MAGPTDPVAAVFHRSLTDIAMGYFESRALAAAARLGVADALANSERPVDELAAECGADPTSLHRLLRALASFGVVAETRPGHFVLTEYGRPLQKDVPDSEWPSVVFWADLLADSWSYLAECVRTGRRAIEVRPEGRRWTRNPKASEIFTAVMGTGPEADEEAFAIAWDFSRYRTAADLGGGGGSLLAAILQRYPHVHGILVDRQEAIDNAAERFQEPGLAGRCTPIAADLREQIPAGADVYIMRYVLHAYDDEAAIGILRQCRSVLPPDGRLLLIEIVLPDVIDRADRDLEAQLMSDLNMLAVIGGRERNALEWKRLLTAAGLECRAIIPVPGEEVSIIEAGAAVSHPRQPAMP